MTPRDADTEIGGRQDSFPRTQNTVLEAMNSADTRLRSAAAAHVAAAYWKPVYKYIRIKWRAPNDEAKDLTQGFFARATEAGFWEKFNRQKASFRTYVRICVDGFVANERKAAGRIKRGGAVATVSMDFEIAETEFVRTYSADAPHPDAVFHREWVRSVFSEAVDSLRRSCECSDRMIHYALFEKYDLGDPVETHRPTYDVLAGQFGITVTQVTNYLAYARRTFRAAVIDQLRALSASEDEFQDDVRQLLGNHAL